LVFFQPEQALDSYAVRTKSSRGDFKNSDQLKGKWKQAKGEGREKWGKLTVAFNVDLQVRFLGTTTSFQAQRHLFRFLSLKSQECARCHE